jgi:hypothetical protein
MDIFFTALGIVIVLAVWPALLLYAWNDSMLRHPRQHVVRDALARRRSGARPRAIGAVSRHVAGASAATPGVPARR